MTLRVRAWQAVVLLTVMGYWAAGALAVSGRGLAISRAFSYAYNNPQIGVGEGPLGSSIYGYGGDSLNIPRSGSGPNYPMTSSPLSDSMRSVRVYTPMAPMAIAPSGSSAVMAPVTTRSHANPVRDVVSVLSEQDKEKRSITTPALKSLAPDDPPAIRLAIIQGEDDMRQGQYQEAVVSFEAARKLSGGSPESLLSLAQAYFALGGKSYGQAADCLAKAIALFPDLPLVRVRPKDFFSGAGEYDKARANLEGYVKDNPKDAGALFLLGYVQLREGLIDKAMASLDAAAAASPGKDLADGITGLQNGIARSGRIVMSEAPALNQARGYPWAGVRLALPASFKDSPSTSANRVLAGMVAGKDGQDSQLITLDAYSVRDTVPLSAFMESSLDAMRRAKFVKDLRMDSEAEVPFQTGQGLVRIFTYATPDDSKIALARLAFIRQPKDKKSRPIGYLLSVAASDKQIDKLLPALAAIAKSIVLSEPVSPSPAGVDVQGSVIEDRHFHFSIVQPASWAGRQTDKGFQMGQMDFAGGDVVSPKAEVIVQSIPNSYTPQSFGQEAIKRPAPKGIVKKVISQGPAKLAGVDGYQFVVAHVAEEDGPAASSMLAGRLICVNKKDGSQTLYAVVVECRGAQADDVAALADKIDANFKLLPSAK